ncbi:MAG: hypothetical protein IJJ82_07875 [Clostridia bacterium]|nr:hypothetical protein [Clostridia bacterium]
MDNKVINKQIPVKSIIDVANYLENYKDDYDRRIQIDENKNRNLEYDQKVWEYGNASTEIRYTIELHNGKTMTESNYNWFISNLNEPSYIKRISIDLRISFYTTNRYNNSGDEYSRINAEVDFRDAGMELRYSDAVISVDTQNQESEANNLYYGITDILENNEERYNKTIKSRKLRMQSFCISVGIILSYIVFVILKINENNLPNVIHDYLNNKAILILGQWFIAILFGNLFSHWYIMSIYRPLIPDAKYAGYDSSTGRSRYTDDINDYLEHSEVHIGKYWDAEKRRNKIEKIYKITSKILLVQLAISLILFLILK